MKMTKRIFSLALCLVLMLALALPAMAADETYTLTINNATDGHTYEAYQIFSGSLVNVDGKDILSDIKWGSSIPADKQAALMDALEAAFPDLKATNTEGNRLYERTAAGVAEYLQDNITTDSESIDLFAEVIGAKNASDVDLYLSGVAGESVYVPAEKDAEGNVTKAAYYTISNLNAGYYLVKDKDNTLDGKNDFYTKYIIRVLKDQTVAPKGEVPTVEKTINDTLDGTYTDVEDFDINDTAYYKWEGTLPSNLKSYNSYFYKFNDTLPTGLLFLEFQQIYIEGHDGNLVHKFYDITDSVDTNDTLPVGITKSVAGQNVTLEFNDLLTLYKSILPTQKIVVKYTARVTRDALVAQPMTNSVYVDFSNNPNGDGIGDTGTTPEDVAHAFTFQITVDKYDADKPSTKLPGAEFVLYYERTVSDAVVKYYAQVVTEEMVYVFENGKIKLDADNKPVLLPEDQRILVGSINTTPLDGDDIGVVYGWTDDITQASVLDTDAKGALKVKGLDEGIYYLKETKAPAGYNLMETPVQIKIIPSYTASGDEMSVTVSYEVDSIAQSSDTVGVRNSSGSTLPVTGGAGTTMFYVVGGLLVAAAVVMLISKRRVEE